MSDLVSRFVQQSISAENQNSDSNIGNEDNKCSAMLIDLEALHCPFCCNALTDHIFQCDEGHIVCSKCCDKLRNKCPSCSLPVGRIRCRAMERVMKSIIVPCPNSNSGCTKSFSFGNEVTHEKNCVFSPCSCPAENCNYTGFYKDLYSHFSIHSDQRFYSHQFKFGQYSEIFNQFTDYLSFVMKEENDGVLFVIQCFREPIGVYVTMSCIAPNSVEVGEFSCSISSMFSYPYLKFELQKVRRIQELISFETLEDDFMLVPSYIMKGCLALKLGICIKKLNKK